jgi:small subunit ribosomal protein S19e
MSIKDVPSQTLITRLSEELKKLKELQPPKWSYYTKTGVHREHPPDQPDWWYARAASVLRRIHLDGPVGVSRLRTYYGGKQKRGSAPEHSRRGGGKIIRTILQQLENAGLVSKIERNGRRISPSGESLLNRAASQAKAGTAEESGE